MSDHPTASSQAPQPDEFRLVHQAKSGDSEAFARLYDSCVDRVHRYIYFRVSDDETAEDLTSRVFLKAWENLNRYRSGSSPFIAWLYTIAKNLVIDHYRTQKESVALEDVVLAAPEAFGDADLNLDASADVAAEGNTEVHAKAEGNASVEIGGQFDPSLTLGADGSMIVESQTEAEAGGDGLGINLTSLINSTLGLGIGK